MYLQENSNSNRLEPERISSASITSNNLGTNAVYMEVPFAFDKRLASDSSTLHVEKCADTDRHFIPELSKPEEQEQIKLPKPMSIGQAVQIKAFSPILEGSHLALDGSCNNLKSNFDVKGAADDSVDTLPPNSTSSTNLVQLDPSPSPGMDTCAVCRAESSRSTVETLARDADANDAELTHISDSSAIPESIPESEIADGENVSSPQTTPICRDGGETIRFESGALVTGHIDSLDGAHDGEQHAECSEAVASQPQGDGAVPARSGLADPPDTLPLPSSADSESASLAARMSPTAQTPDSAPDMSEPAESTTRPSSAASPG